MKKINMPLKESVIENTLKILTAIKDGRYLYHDGKRITVLHEIRLSGLYMSRGAVEVSTEHLDCQIVVGIDEIYIVEPN